MSLHHAQREVKPLRTPISTYHPANMPRVTACIVYADPIFIRIAVSNRSCDGMLRTPPAIAWDAEVLDQLERDGVEWLEVAITGGLTYRTSMDTIRTHCKYANRFGLQAILSLKYWTVDGQNSESESKSELDAPEAVQLDLFGGAA